MGQGQQGAGCPCMHGLQPSHLLHCYVDCWSEAPGLQPRSRAACPCLQAGGWAQLAGAGVAMGHLGVGLQWAGAGVAME